MGLELNPAKGFARGRGRLVACLAFLLPLSAVAAPGVLLFPAVGTPTHVTVSGRVLKEAPTKGTSKWSKNLRDLTASNWEGAPVELQFDGQKAKVTSGKDGVFEVTFAAPKEQHFVVGASFAEARVPEAVARAPVTIIHDDAPFLIISDFDDTVAVTNVLSKRGLLKSALLSDGDTQPVVKGMPEWYRCMFKDKAQKPGLAMVSGSPHQFAPRITTFMAKHDFPVGGLYLRNLGPQTLSGYKQPIIRSLLKAMPVQPVILIGDSGEHDPEVYKQIREEFPGRIKDIYIHDVGRNEVADRFRGMILFKEPVSASKDAVSKGYVTAECHEAAFGK